MRYEEPIAPAGQRSTTRVSRATSAARLINVRNTALLTCFVATIFVNAALLFLIQPMFARMILPHFGGSPAVWNTAVVVYQALLLGGYVYAHLMTHISIRRQAVVHLALLATALLVLPIGLPAGWSPPLASNPVPALLGLMLLAVGLPFFVISAGSPLLQSWFSRTSHGAGADPYFLYVASNAGSLVGLLGYPLLLEPTLRLSEQSQLWTIGYSLLVVLLATCAVWVWRAPNNSAPAPNQSKQPNVPAPSDVLSLPRRARWVLLAFVPSSLMLSVTTDISTDVSPFPLLWVIPLGLYLLTFILAFRSTPRAPRRLTLRWFPVALLFSALIGIFPGALPLAAVPFQLIGFFLIALVCHGALAQDRPPAQRLTEFYFWLSFGGMLGGVLNALVAPALFSGIAEYPLVVAIACGLALTLPSVDKTATRRWADVALPTGCGIVIIALIALLHAGDFYTRERAWLIAAGLPAILCVFALRRPLRFGLSVGVMLCAVTILNLGADGRLLVARRSFFGITQVVRDPQGAQLLMHGSTLHGVQIADPALRTTPMAYYHPEGPFGTIFQAFSADNPSFRVAVAGLGAGGLNCYAQPGQQWTFYEIDPVVVDVAGDPRYFSYLQDCGDNPQIVLGDARVTLGVAPDQHYDLIVLDAYSSDAVPIHLVTREALALYQQKLAPHGKIVFHISNRNLDLEPVLSKLAHEAGLVSRVRHDQHKVELTTDFTRPSSTKALIMARTEADLGALANDRRWAPTVHHSDTPLWTDDFSSILSVLRR